MPRLDHVARARDHRAYDPTDGADTTVLLGDEGRRLFRHPKRICWVVQFGRAVVGLTANGHLAFPERYPGETKLEYVLGLVANAIRHPRAQLLHAYRGGRYRDFSPFTNPSRLAGVPAGTPPAEFADRLAVAKAVVRRERRLFAAAVRARGYPDCPLENDPRLWYSPAELRDRTAHFKIEMDLACAAAAWGAAAGLPLVEPDVEVDGTPVYPGRRVDAHVALRHRKGQRRFLALTTGGLGIGSRRLRWLLLAAPQTPAPGHVPATAVLATVAVAHLEDRVRTTRDAADANRRRAEQRLREDVLNEVADLHRVGPASRNPQPDGRVAVNVALRFRSAAQARLVAGALRALGATIPGLLHDPQGG